MMSSSFGIFDTTKKEILQLFDEYMETKHDLVDCAFDSESVFCSIDVFFQ